LLENQFIYPSPKGSKLILAAPSSPAELDSVLRSPWGRGKRRTEEKLNEVKINKFSCLIPDTHVDLFIF
jgi:hypothetical protein